MKRDRPTVIADAQDLPFKDNEFDYVICCHILEHVENPDLFFSEITRVARRGYIETPSEINERLAPKPYHLWFANAQKGRLLLKPKKCAYDFGVLFDYLYGNDELFRLFHQLHPEIFLTRYYWDDKIDYEILPADDQFQLDIASREVVEELVNVSKAPLEKEAIKKILRKVPGMQILKKCLGR